MSPSRPVILNRRSPQNPASDSYFGPLRRRPLCLSCQRERSRWFALRDRRRSIAAGWCPPGCQSTKKEIRKISITSITPTLGRDTFDKNPDSMDEMLSMVLSFLLSLFYSEAAAPLFINPSGILPASSQNLLHLLFLRKPVRQILEPPFFSRLPEK